MIEERRYSYFIPTQNLNYLPVMFTSYDFLNSCIYLGIKIKGQIQTQSVMDLAVQLDTWYTSHSSSYGHH